MGVDLGLGEGREINESDSVVPKKGVCYILDKVIDIFILSVWIAALMRTQKLQLAVFFRETKKT